MGTAVATAAAVAEGMDTLTRKEPSQTRKQRYFFLGHIYIWTTQGKAPHAVREA